MVKILVISICNPILVGIYNDDILEDIISMNGKTSDILPEIFKNILKKYDILEMLYVNGPGSFMAIKVTYMFLKTLSTVQNIPLKACDGFAFNYNTPIKALGKKYFFKRKNGKIELDFLEQHNIKDFKLPQKLDITIFKDENLPSYNLPAVN